MFFILGRRRLHSGYMRMVRAFVLLSATASLAFTAELDVADTIRELAPGRRVEVTLQSGARISGTLRGANTVGFLLDPDQKSMAIQALPYSDVRAVQPRMTPARKWTIGAIIVGALTTLGIILQA
jgi:hypothetical protein